MTYNCIYGNRFYALKYVTDDPTNIALDPELAGIDQTRLDGLQSSVNMHIQHDSPCVNAVTDGTLRDTVDIDGQPRTIGDYADVGAYESDGLDYDSGSVVVRVDGANGNDNNDGSSWGLAMRTIQAAIDKVAVTGGDVWVKGSRTFNERVTLRPFIYLVGACSGNETARPSRTGLPGLSCVIDGQSLGRVVTLRGGYRTNLIDGFIIRHGSVAGRGAGVFCSNASPVIRYNQIDANSATTGIHYTSSGGGIYCSYGAPLIEGNWVGMQTLPNYANSGGGIGIESSIATIIRNAIWHNTSGSQGGGIHVDAPLAYGTLLIENNYIDHNSTYYNGAGLDVSGSGNYENALIVAYNTITNNSSPAPSYSWWGGGGIYLSCTNWALIADNIVASNRDGIWRSGGSLPTLTRNCVWNNGTANYYNVNHPTDINVDPKIDSLWWIRSDSPCRNNQGTPGYTISIDIDGQSRPMGGYYDIGCDEYNE